MILWCSCLILGFTGTARACAQDKEAATWEGVLKNDSRLKAPVTFFFPQETWGTDQVFAILTKATGVKVSLAMPPTEGKVVFGIMGFSGQPAHAAMKVIADRQFVEGRWEKTEGGYQLHGKPKKTRTAQEQQDWLAKKHLAWVEILEKDPRLKAPVTLVLPKETWGTEPVLDVLAKMLGVPLSLANPPSGSKMVFFSLGFASRPGHYVLKRIADDHMIDGKWEKFGNGYQLHGKPKTVRTKEEDIAARTPPAWVSILEMDQRLKERITFKSGGKPGSEEVFKSLTDLTGVPMSLATPPKEGKIFFGAMQFTNQTASYVMIKIAQQFSEGKWEKAGDGYKLHGKAKRVLSPEDEAELANRSKPKTLAPWEEALQNDPRLAAKMTFNLANQALVEDRLEVIAKATGVPLALAEAFKDGKIMIPGSSAAAGAPARDIMRALAVVHFVDGKWEKVGDGYRLHGKPKNVITHAQLQEAAAKKKAQDEAMAKAAKKREELIAALPLRSDIKLRAKLTVKQGDAKLADMLRLLDRTTGLRVTLAENLTYHEPKLGMVQFPDAPAFALMELIAATDLENGRWVKNGDGYRLEGVSKSLAPPSPSSHVGFRWNLLLYGTGVVVLALGLIVFFWQWRRRNGRTVSTPVPPRNDAKGSDDS